jgi:hypothetical protein
MEGRMKHWRFHGVMALLLLTPPPQASRANGCGILLPESKPPGVQYLSRRSIESGHHQAESTAPPNAWRGLVPLKSSRADVERMLGSSTGSVGDIYLYETKDEKVRVVYSQGSCEPSLEGQWKVPADTVLSTTVFPQSKVLVNSLRLDMTVYKRSQEVHPENWVWYVSSETGVMVHAIQKNGG